MFLYGACSSLKCMGFAVFHHNFTISIWIDCRDTSAGFKHLYVCAHFSSVCCVLLLHNVLPSLLEKCTYEVLQNICTTGLSSHTGHVVVSCCTFVSTILAWAYCNDCAVQGLPGVLLKSRKSIGFDAAFSSTQLVPNDGLIRTHSHLKIARYHQVRWIYFLSVHWDPFHV